MRLIFLLCIFISLAFSHRLSLFLNQEGNKVFASAYFASGSFCMNCDIRVKDENGKLIQSGKTDKKGEFIITKLSPKITVDVETIGGHAARDTLEIEKSSLDTNEDNKKLEELESEIRRLKSENKLLQDELNRNELFKMIFALLVIVGVFVFLKKVRK